MESIGGCKKLHKFKIERCDLESLIILTNFVELSVLVLQEVYVSQLMPSDFNSSSNLKTLDLTGSSRLAQTILGNPSVLIKFQNLETLTLKNCDLKDLSWIPIKEDVTIRTSPFSSLSTVEFSGNNSFDCQDHRIKQALCRFDNLKRVEYPSPKIVNNRAYFRLENSNTTNCRDKQMSFISILHLDFSDCKEKLDGHINWGSYTSTELPTTTKSITQTDHFQSQEEAPSRPSKVGYIILGVLLVILFLVAIALAVIYYRRRRCDAVQVSSDSSTKQGVTNPQEVQSEV